MKNIVFILLILSCLQYIINKKMEVSLEYN